MGIVAVVVVVVFVVVVLDDDDDDDDDDSQVFDRVSMAVKKASISFWIRFGGQK
jgi:hypothetical protein